MSRVLNTLMFGFLFLLSSWQICPNSFAQTKYPQWPFRYSPSIWNRPLQDVAFGNGTFVAIGRSGTILTSKDGIHWTNHSSDFSIVSNNCANINFSTETYSADGDTVTFMEVKRVSSDADIVTNHLSLFQYYNNHFPGQLVSIAFGRGTFVIIGAYGQILTSHDGEHWVASALPRMAGLITLLHGVTAGDSGFVAVGQHGMIFTSPDGLNWTQRDSGVDEIIYSVAYGNGRYVAFADNNTTYTSVLTSSDGVKWTPSGGDLRQINSITFGNGVFLGTMTFDGFPPQFVGEQPGKWSSGPTMISTDGKNWREVAPPIPSEGLGVFNTSFPTHLTFSGGLFIATAFGDISTSKDGINWNPSTGLKSEYYGATYGNGTFVAVGNGAVIKDTNTVSSSAMTIAHSEDAITWEFSRCPPSRLLWGNLINEKLFKLGYDFDLSNTNETSYLGKLLGIGNSVNEKYFTMGTDADLKTTNEYSYLVTSDAETWTTSDKTSITGFVSGNKTVTYTDKIPVVLTSKDGIEWTRLAPIHSDRPAPIPTPAIAGNTQTAATSDNGVSINLNGQSYKLNLNSSIGKSMEIQASSDLQNWETLTTITNTGGVINFVDPDAKNYPERFYRLKLQ
jgi:hypothetical protein